MSTDIYLTLNVDGIQPSKGSQQGIWPGPTKPSREEMKVLFRPLVDELVTLEKGTIFKFYNEHDASVATGAFPIGACCDKLAQSILQFLLKPTEPFGCGSCEMEGN
jgi:hypothetical protein